MISIFMILLSLLVLSLMHSAFLSSYLLRKMEFLWEILSKSFFEEFIKHSWQNELFQTKFVWNGKIDLIYISSFARESFQPKSKSILLLHTGIIGKSNRISLLFDFVSWNWRIELMHMDFECACVLKQKQR